jgi:hypothetical protein
MKTLARLLVIGLAAGIVVAATWALVSRTGVATASTRNFENRPAFAIEGARPEGLAGRRGGEGRGGHHDLEAGSASGWLTLGKNILVVGALTVGVAGVTLIGDRLRRTIRRSTPVRDPR